MNLFFLSYRNLKANPWRLSLNLLLLAMGVGLISLLMVLEDQLDRQFRRNLEGIQMVVGAKGSPLQLILSAVYQLDAPTGNIPLSEAEKLQRHPMVKSGIPLAYGDNYQGFRIVGTSPTYLQLYDTEISQGRVWNAPLEVVAGAEAAQRLGLKVGSTFLSQHGLDAAGQTHEGKAFEVVGVTRRSGTVADQLLLTSVESLWAVHEQHEHEYEAHTEDKKEITALLLSFKTPLGAVVLPRFINENTNLQAALPAYQMSRLLENIGLGVRVLQGVALAVMLVSGISIFISLYTSLRERRYELALLRALGASRWRVFRLILQEGLLLSLTGSLIGWLAGRAGIYALNRWAETKYHYGIRPEGILPQEWALLGAVLLIGLLAALLPALRAYQSAVSETLLEG